MTSFIKRRILTSETLGERLRKIREGRSLDFQEVETVINIRGAYLKCLENGDYAGLPGEVYVKSFLKSYGSFLGLSEEEVTEQYEKERRIDDYKMMTEHVAAGRDLFGNKPGRSWQGLGWRRIAKRTVSKSFLKSMVLSQVFIKGVVIALILGVLFYLGWEIKEIVTPPYLTSL